MSRKLLVFAFACAVTQAFGQSAAKREGARLYETVKKYVSLGEHRTGTPADFATSAWLKSELANSGYRTEYLSFPVKQFFYQGGNISAGSAKLDVFPFWPVKEGLLPSAKGILIDGDKNTAPAKWKGKLILTRLPVSGGATNPAIEKHLAKFIQAGAKGVLAITPGATGEIVAHNTNKTVKPWSVPVWYVAPKDSNALKSGLSKEINVEVRGSFKTVNAFDVVGRIGSGKKYVVISTPISGWFTCGGERGPGIAVWLELAQWIGENINKYPAYTFVFTGNSGHELNGLGASVFVEKAAPKPEETSLWIHLGAGIAVKAGKEENGKYVLSDIADAGRSIYYNEAVAASFEKAFAGIEAHKNKGTEANKETVKPGGEGAHYMEKGYKNLVSIAYAHRYHHVKTDDERYTSPEILFDISKALKDFISSDLK